MKNFEKYERTYFMPPEVTYDWVKREAIEQPPIWCSVDLRDGNQALIEPMNLEEKIDFFRMLIAIGFKEIEVGFPAASDAEYTFLRTLIERGMIPEDVMIQVLTQADEEMIRKTFEAVKGARHTVIHLFNSTSPVQREQVLGKGKEEVKKMAAAGAALIKRLADETEGAFTFEYSPEGFSETETAYALEVSNAVLDVWKPDTEHKAIINLPATVENALPHVFACQVEYFAKHLKYREHVILSIHPHNDRGCAVAAAEFGVLAGADRVEGSLFGNGERSGNVDLITLAMNMFSHGIDPGLNFSDMTQITREYERLTRMEIGKRHPYAGELVFSTFSGLHQDAIARGMKHREEHPHEKWTVPYLPIDPKDVGRQYESDVIRINSQSGKGGISYILKRNYGINMPERMKDEVGSLIKEVSDKSNKELTPEWVYHIFEDYYIIPRGVFYIEDSRFRKENGILADATIVHGQGKHTVTGSGNGRLDAISNAIKQYFGISYELAVYEEHSLTKGSSSKAVAYVGVVCNGKGYWGVGIDADIISASIEALTVAVNKIEKIRSLDSFKDERMIEIMNFIQENYIDVTLERLSEKFYLSKPYLSKYIKEKAGSTFGDIVKRVRMKKARTMLKSSTMTVESIAESVGYQNVEHFNRLFKKAYSMTPVQFRNHG